MKLIIRIYLIVILISFITGLVLDFFRNKKKKMINSTKENEIRIVIENSNGDDTI